MIFVTGPLFAGKREWVRRALGLDCLASLCVIVMTVAFTLRVLAF